MKTTRNALGKGGRAAAPFFPTWGPVLLKSAGALAAAVVLAVIGARAGAHALGGVQTAASTTIGVEAPDGAPPAATIEPSPSTDAGRAASAGALPDGRVVLNLADEAALVQLPGIGPVRARAILLLRQRLGKFKSVDQISRVKGIGRKTLQRIRPRVLVDPPRPIIAENDAG